MRAWLDARLSYHCPRKRPLTDTVYVLGVRFEDALTPCLRKSCFLYDKVFDVLNNKISAPTARIEHPRRPLRRWIKLLQRVWLAGRATFPDGVGSTVWTGLRYGRCSGVTSGSIQRTIHGFEVKKHGRLHVYLLPGLMYAMHSSLISIPLKIESY